MAPSVEVFRVLAEQLAVRGGRPAPALPNSRPGRREGLWPWRQQLPRSPSPLQQASQARGLAFPLNRDCATGPRHGFRPVDDAASAIGSSGHSGLAVHSAQLAHRLWPAGQGERECWEKVVLSQPLGAAYECSHWLEGIGRVFCLPANR